MTPQELKNSILQLAIQGKLVEQRPEEGTGETLFIKLKKHHNQLKPCKDELDFSSLDFDIPESWTWVELNQLFDFVDYRGKTPHKIAEGVFLITASNIKQGFMDYTRKEYISAQEYAERMSRGITKKGDLLFTTEAPMGNAALCDLDICSCGQRIITFQEYEEKTALPALFMYFILSPQFQKQLLDNCTGTTAKGIKAEKLKHFRIPLPPLAEQKRIVAKIEELLPYIDRYEKAWNRLEDFNKHFPADMQKSILQLAIQGKLVEQRPEEGTGEALYQQILKEKQALIKAGKIKKEKPLPEITEDEIPFEIPESWKWIRLGDMIEMLTSGSRDWAQYYSDEGDIFLRMGNLSRNSFDLRLDKIHHVKIPQNAEGQRTALQAGDLLFSITGEVGTLGLIPEAFGKAYINQHTAMIRFLVTLRNKYIPYLLLTDYAQKYYNGNQHGIKNSFRLDSISFMPVPLPPLAEQKRIVDKLEELLPLCERLK